MAESLLCVLLDGLTFAWKGKNINDTEESLRKNTLKDSSPSRCDSVMCAAIVTYKRRVHCGSSPGPNSKQLSPCISVLPCLKTIAASRDQGLAQQEKAFATTPDNLSSIPRGERRASVHASCPPASTHAGWHMPTSTCKINK